MKPVTVVVGGQWGSESKGLVCGWLAMNERYQAAVRTGATNAGHTVEYNGKLYVNQQLPVAWVNRDIALVIGAGALVDLDILERECAMINEAMPGQVENRLYIDHRAYVHRREHADRSKQANRHHTIGATGKGCSEALIDRVRLRGVVPGQMKDQPDIAKRYFLCDTELMLNEVLDGGGRVMIEGTQGQLLDLCLGPYPYTTHKQTGPAVWLAECGISPNVPLDIVMVVRTFPIRVAGNSGPMSREISWPILAREINQRRANHGMPCIVDPSTIAAFEYAVEEVTRTQFADKVPLHASGNEQHAWTGDLRVGYREALSEINKAALALLDDDTVSNLKRLFEMTTVTKKMRRIARLSATDLRVASRQIRPSRIAVTFLNYLFAERWYTGDPLTHEERVWLLDQVEVPCGGAKVFLTGRGPMLAHTLKVEDR